MEVFATYGNVWYIIIVKYLEHVRSLNDKRFQDKAVGHLWSYCIIARLISGSYSYEDVSTKCYCPLHDWRHMKLRIMNYDAIHAMSTMAVAVAVRKR